MNVYYTGRREFADFLRVCYNDVSCGSELLRGLLGKGEVMSKKQICSFLTAVLISASVGPAIHAESTPINPEYQKEVSAIDPEDPASQVMIALWCLDHKMNDKYIYHYQIFLKSRGAHKQKRNPDGYCRTCNGEEEYICDVCDEKRRVTITCPNCKGAGEQFCPRCEGAGKVTCPRCRGLGSYRKKGGVSIGSIDCPRKIRCSKCRGKKIRQCKACRGRGKKRGNCVVCNKYRFRKCAECAEQRERFRKRIQEGALAAAKDLVPDKEVTALPDGTKEVTAADKETAALLDDLNGQEGSALVEKGDSLMAEGFALDRQAITAAAPYPIVKKAESKYERAINHYEAAQKKGVDVDVKLTEGLRMLFWVRKLMPLQLQ